ncbi:MFS transporter [Lactiplantibacillus daoliensis]|uniref:MFS transporter n=1 Tax=Lactiplantibacillus daoliensis TaxID=2559916 RepID=A0ABW1UCT4_9LACO|nr:MFS transporter [Lactiplantibacillus daoliensis]
MPITQNKHSFWFKASILSISIDSTVSGVVSGAIPLMVKSFPNAPQSIVESISSLPSLAIMLAVIISPFVTNKIGYRKTVLIGLAISFLAGIAPTFSPNIYLILAFRFIFGLGIGLLNPLSYSIVAYFYDNDERSQMYGLIGTVSNFASWILTGLVGVLLQFSWHYSFLTYFVLLAILILVYFVLPEMDIKTEVKKEKSHKNNFLAMDHRVYYLAVVMFFLFMVWMTFNQKFGLLVTGKGYGNASQATYILSLTAPVGMIIGIFFGLLHKWLKNILLPLAMFMMALLLLVTAASNSLIVSTFGVVFAAAFFTCCSTSVFLRVSEITPKALNNAASSIELIVVNVGIFVAPYFMSLVGNTLGNNNPDMMLAVCAAILIVLVIAMILGHFLTRNQHQAQSTISQE